MYYKIGSVTFMEPGGKNEDKSETSSAPSSNSGPGSDNNSRKGSAASSPRESPQPSSSVQRPPSEGDASTPGAHSPCRYFIMKAANNKMLVTSEEKGLWATAPSNEKKISKAFKVHSFIHSGYLYSASSSPLLLRGAPYTARTLCRNFTPKRHRQL